MGLLAVKQISKKSLKKIISGLFLCEKKWYNRTMKKKELTREELNKMSAEKLKELVLSQQMEIKNKAIEIENKELEIKRITSEKELLLEQLMMMRAKKFSRSSEKETNYIQLGLFNEAESLYDIKVVEEAKEEEITYKRKKRRKGQREEELRGLDVEIIEHTIPKDELERELGKEYIRFPDAIYKKLKFIPAKFVVEEHHIAVYRSTTTGKIIRAKHPVSLMDHSMVTPSLAAGIINAKYVNHQPLNRIEKAFKANDCVIRRQVMANWMIQLTERYCSLVYDRLKKELLCQDILHVDETPVTVRKDNRKAGAKSYMWVYRSLEREDKQIVLYDYAKTRASEAPANYLNDYQGIIVSDGYQVYHKLAKDSGGDITVAGCWVHALRKFKDSAAACGDSDKKKAKFLLANEAIRQIQKICHEDNKLKNLSDEDRLKVRKTVIKQLVTAFFEWVNFHKDDVTRGSNTGKAFQYVLNQKPYLMTFLSFANAPHDNNAAERAIRPFTIGRNNWQIIDTISGAKSSAILYSLVETAKANQLKVYDYLNYLLEELPKHMVDHNLDFLDNLMPWSKALPDNCRDRK